MKTIAIGIFATSLFSHSIINAQENVGYFEAEGQKIETRFVRVIYAGEGSEDGAVQSTQQLTFQSTDPKGNKVEVYRFQLVTKNTGYDELQESQEQDYKLKKVANGVKLHIEVPVENGNMQLDKAYVGNLAYNFGTKETRNNLQPNTVSNIKFQLKKLDLPKFESSHHPGDKGMIYNQGYIQFELYCDAVDLKGSKTQPFIVSVDAPISLTHVRGKERAAKAVAIDAEIVKRNK